MTKFCRNEIITLEKTKKQINPRGYFSQQKKSRRDGIIIVKK